jgi:hypothetical protein
MTLRTWLVLGLGFGGVAGCGGDTAVPKGSEFSITNPTGSCKAPDNGGRRGYHAPDTGDVWLRDCKLPLKREYWRVFAVSEASAYIVPRPDGAPQVAEVCADSEHDLHALVEQYALCEPATDASVDLVNDMAPADALALTRYLHTRLVFEVVPGGIAPYPLPTDIIDACALEPDQNSAAFVELCEREQARLDSGHDIGFSYEGPGAAELAERLNDLYGIESASCDDRLQNAGTRRSELIESVERACETEADCTVVSVEVACLTSCGGILVTDTAAEEFSAAIEQLDETVCAPFTAAGCEPPAPSSCPPFGQAHGCIEGRCQ